MPQTTTSLEYREAAKSVHRQIGANSTDVMSVKETAEQIALLCEDHSLSTVVAKRSILNRIRDELPSSPHADVDASGEESDEMGNESIENTLSPEAQELAVALAEGEYERTTCSTCGGLGEIEKTVKGVPMAMTVKYCDDCNNVPKSPIPDNPPANPDAKINRLEQQLEENEKRAAEMAQIQHDVDAAKKRINSIIESEHVGDDTRTALAHIRDNFTQSVRDGIEPRRYIPVQKRPVNKRISRLEGYKKALEHAASRSVAE